MSDFPVGVAAPDGAQKLVSVCKGTWAVIQDESSDINANNKAVESSEVAMHELNEMGVHVNNEGGFTVFTSGVKQTAYDPPALVELNFASRCPWTQRKKAVRPAGSPWMCWN
jgi:hypothetical protein